MWKITSTLLTAFNPTKSPRFSGASPGKGEAPSPPRTYSYGFISLQPPQTPPHLEAYEAARLPAKDIYRIYEMYSPESYCKHGTGGRAALTGMGAGALYLGLTGTAKDFLQGAKPFQALLKPFSKQVEPAVKEAATHMPMTRSTLFMIPALSWSASVLADAFGIHLRASRPPASSPALLPATASFSEKVAGNGSGMSGSNPAVRTLPFYGGLPTRTLPYGNRILTRSLPSKGGSPSYSAIG